MDETTKIVSEYWMSLLPPFIGVIVAGLVAYLGMKMEEKRRDRIEQARYEAQYKFETPKEEIEKTREAIRRDKQFKE